MKIIFLEIDDSRSRFIGNVCIFDVPLSRYGPIQNFGAAFHLTYFQGNTALENLKRLSHTISCE